MLTYAFNTIFSSLLVPGLFILSLKAFTTALYGCTTLNSIVASSIERVTIEAMSKFTLWIPPLLECMACAAGN